MNSIIGSNDKPSNSVAASLASYGMTQDTEVRSKAFASNDESPAIYAAPAAAGHTPIIPMIAEDSDVIEDEWVDIIRSVVKQYKSDPFALSRAITALRIDYMKKRYSRNMDIASQP